MKNNTGITLIEMIIGLLLGSLIMLTAFSIYLAVGWSFLSQKSSFLCMQSLRTAVLQMDRDLAQCAYLLPQDMKVYCSEDSFYVAGLPATTGNAGLMPSSTEALPYFSIVSSIKGNSITVDTADIDNNGTPDYRAGSGVLSDHGGFEIVQNYTKGAKIITLRKGTPEEGDRVVPAVLYTLKKDGLYRNGQLLSEGISGFSAVLSGKNLNIQLKAARNGTSREITYDYPVWQ